MSETSAQLLAAGYPHLRRLVTPHPDEPKAIARAKKALEELDAISYHVFWPRDVALRYLRGLGEVGPHGIGIFSNHMELPESKAALAAIEAGGEIDDKLARSIISSLLAPDAGGYEFHAPHAVFLLEQLVGGAAVVDAALACWERMKPATWDKSTVANALAYSLGFVLARLPPAKRAPLAARAAKLAKHGRGPNEAAFNYTGEFLDLITGGAAAVARSSDRRIGLYWLHFVDDPALLLAAVAETPDEIDAHHLARGGDALLDILAAKVKKVPKWRKPWLADELRVIGSKRAKAIADALAPAKKPAAKKPAAKKR